MRYNLSNDAYSSQTKARPLLVSVFSSLYILKESIFHVTSETLFKELSQSSYQPWKNKLAFGVGTTLHYQLLHTLVTVQNHKRSQMKRQLFGCTSRTVSNARELTSVSMCYSQGDGVNTSLSRLLPDSDPL